MCRGISNEFTRKYYPHYLFQDQYSGQILQGVHHKDIKKIYNPIETVKHLLNKLKLSDLEKESISFIKILSKGVARDSLGISGSLMVGLHTPKSDMDIVVYGMDASHKVHECLTEIIDNRKHNVRPMTNDELRELHYFRNQHTESAFSTFVQLEKRKHISGMFNNREFFMRFVKDPSEIDEQYENHRYKKVGFAVVKGRVVDDSIRPLFLYYYNKYLNQQIPVFEIILWFVAFVVINLFLTATFYKKSTSLWNRREFI